MALINDPSALAGRPATYVIEFQVRPGMRPRFLTLLDGVLDAMRHESRFRSATLNVDPADPDHFLLHETWEDHDDVLQVQLERPYRDAWHQSLDSVLASPRRISAWAPLRSDRAAALPASVIDPRHAASLEAPGNH